MTTTLRKDMGLSLTAISVGRMVADMAPSRRAEYLKVIADMLPEAEREATLMQTLDLVRGKTDEPEPR